MPLSMFRNQLSPQTMLMTIASYISGFDNNDYSLPEWQRDDCWPIDGAKQPIYAMTLIKSIMEGIDIPKIYIGKVNSATQFIIDGGHRTRAMANYMKNKFAIRVGEMSIYYNQNPSGHDTTRTRVMDAEERSYFDNYKITIGLYNDISESRSRDIFNHLQNARPMSIQDVVNSYQSPLTDYLRSFLKGHMDGRSVWHIFSSSKSLPNPDNSEGLYQLLSFFTIAWPNATGSSKKAESMKWIEKGKTENSKCYTYLKNFSENNEGIVPGDAKELFEKLMDFVFEQTEGKKVSASDLNTLSHAFLWIPGFDVESFFTFIDDVEKFKKMKSHALKLFKKGNREQGSSVSSSADALDVVWEGDLSRWQQTRTSGGSSESGMNIRVDMVEKWCMSSNDDDDDDDEYENPLDNAEELETVVSLMNHTDEMSLRDDEID